MCTLQPSLQVDGGAISLSVAHELMERFKALVMDQDGGVDTLLVAAQQGQTEKPPVILRFDDAAVVERRAK